MSDDDHSRDGPGRGGQQDGPPPPQPVRVAGILDTISASQPEILLRLKDDTLVPGHLHHHDPEELRALFATPVVISGLARFDQDRRLVRVDVEYIGSAREADAMWEKLPVPRPGRGDPVFRPEPQDEHTGVNAIFGIWPGDETEEELLEALKDVRRGSEHGL